MDKLSRNQLAVLFFLVLFIVTLHPDLRLPFGAAVVVSALVVSAAMGLGWWFEFQEKRECDGYQRLSKELGLNYEPFRSHFQLSDIVPVPFQKPLGKFTEYVNAWHLIKGEHNGIDFTICDVHFGCEDNNSSGGWTISQTVILARPEQKPDVPEFELRRTKLAMLTSGEKIFVLEDHISTHEDHRLFCSDPAGKKFFVPEVVKKIAIVFNTFPYEPVSLSFKDGCFVFCISGKTIPLPNRSWWSKKVDVNEWMTFIETSTQLFRLLTDRSNGKNVY